MDCEQAQDAFEKLIDSQEPVPSVPGLEEHLATCPECHEWFAQELLAVNALELLDAFPAPSDFTTRVLSQLLDPEAESKSIQVARVQSPLTRIQDAWDALKAGLARPTSRRRWATAAAFGALLVLALSVVFGLWGNDVPSTPGAATGQASWGFGLAVIVVVFAFVVALVYWRREK